MEKLPDTTLASHLFRSATANWDRPAIVDSSGRSLSYGETLTEANRIANWLAAASPNQLNIGVFLPAGVAAALANYGITLSGRAAVNLNFTSGQQNCRLAIERCELRSIITSRAFLNRLAIDPLPGMVFLEDLPATETFPDRPHEPIGPDSTACILFSSGSTGIPKGIELTHWNILANAEGLAQRIPPGPDDCMLGVLPFFHSFGYTFALWFPLLHGLRGLSHDAD